MFPSLGRIKERRQPLPPNHLKSPPTFILKMIILMLSTQFSLKVPINLRLPQKYQQGTIEKRGQMPLIVNTVFDDV
jgi:hypothetical protein